MPVALSMLRDAPGSIASSANETPMATFVPQLVPLPDTFAVCDVPLESVARQIPAPTPSLP